MPTPTYDLISSVSLNASTVTVSSIPNTYKDLIIVMKAQLVSGSEELRIRFNGDTAANYKRGTIGSRWDAGGTAWFNQTNNLNSIETNFTQNSGYPQTLVLHVHDYNNTSKVKAFQGLSTSNRSDSNTVGNVQHIIGAWNNTNAITSVSFVAGGTPNSISIGSIYGIG
jgi:hypothetical protein